MHLPSNPVDRFQKFVLFIFLALILLYFGRMLFIPMSYGLFIAIVLFPVCKYLEKKGWPRSLAITAGLLIVVLLFVLLIWLMILQIDAFSKDLPELQTKLTPAFEQLQKWVATNFHIAATAQNEWWEENTANLSSSTGSMLRNIFTTLLNSIFILFLVPVFSALFLYNREDFVRFLQALTGRSHQDSLREILNDSIHTYFNFIKGMIMVYIIVGALNSAGLLALGIRHAILFGFLTAIMTIIPYIGIFVSALLPITVAWITKDSILYPLGVIAVFAFVQYLEANVIFPKVVGSQLNVSTWATLVAILAGGILWGVSGMILFIPFTGILKIISSYLPGWQSIHILLSRHAADHHTGNP